MIGLIWAQAANGVIGRDNAIPWHLPEDMKHFRAVTSGSAVLMGRRTWDSLPPRFRPLPNRRNLVLTRSASWSAEGASVVHSLDDGLAGGLDGDVWVIGGADVLEVTELQDPFDGDVYAPSVDGSWQVSVGQWQTSSAGPVFRWLRYTR